MIHAQALDAIFKTYPQAKCLYQAYQPYINSLVMNPKTKQLYFVMQNGARIAWDDGQKKTFEQQLKNPDLQDMLSQPYPALQSIKKLPKYNQDPGRFRNEAFFQAVYGANKQAVINNLVKVRWMPKTDKTPYYLLFNKQNGAAAALQRVSNALDLLPDKDKKFVARTAGTFNYRLIAGTKRHSPHAFGLAIDVNTKYSNYWRWDNKQNLQSKHLVYHNRMPQKIVDIFEKNGFVWGGRWYHYDTMHFEYRPAFSCVASKM